MKRLLPLLLLSLLAAHAHARQPAPAREDDGRPFLHQLFGDRMVLQRGVRFPVWGWTTPGARVVVRMLGRETTAVADASGRWTARLGPFDAGGPHTLNVGGPQTVTLKDVLVGDGRFVWAEASIEGGEVVVRSPRVERPAAVCYGWADNPDGNLYNRAGLPASPFRTDDFPPSRANTPGR